MFVIESPYGYVVSEVQDPRSRWVELDELEQPE